MITVDMWQLLAAVSGLLGLVAAIARALLLTYVKQLDQRFEHIESLRMAGVSHWEQRFIALTQLNRELNEAMQLMKSDREFITRDELQHALDTINERMNRYSQRPHV